MGNPKPIEISSKLSIIKPIKELFTWVFIQRIYHFRPTRIMVSSGNYQQRFYIIENCISLPLVEMTLEEKTTRAEIKMLLKTIQKNLSFASHDEDDYADAFDDSLIAKNYKMRSSKASYVTIYGLAPYLTEQIVNDMKDAPFRYQFDESTNTQVKKQYDAYVYYFSEAFGKCVSHYIGTLFVGHCTAKDLEQHYYCFEKKMKWDSQYLLQVGMDGPTVNTCFYKSLEKDFATKQKTLLDLPTCTVHKLHNSFRDCINSFKSMLDINRFLCDVHFFFKLSAGRREDYDQVALQNEIEAKIISKHVETRWLSMRKCLEIVAEQWQNLKEYFLQFIPKSPAGKDVLKTDRYKRLKIIFEDDLNLIMFNSVAYIAKTLEDFLVPFQSKKPTCHLYHTKMEELLHNILSNFIKRSAVTKRSEKKEEHRKSLHELADVDVGDSSNCLELSKCHFGSTANNLILKYQEQKTNSDSIQKMTTVLFKMYVKLAKSIQTKQPLKNDTLRCLQYIHPNLRAKPDAGKLIRELALSLGRSLRNTKILKGYSPETYADTIFSEFQMYQTDTDDVEDIGSSEDIDLYWKKIRDIKTLN